ncbi:MAG: capsular biosynthesis protein [Lachnospiraceae bacterium]|nr:capsular biosynthesis protein [Lachnospiraceae bacterium]
MTDIHCHLLFGVDDGADTREMSILMLREAKAQGIDKIILTPHYRPGMFDYDKEKIEAAFDSLKKDALDNDISIYLGCEYHVDGYMTENIRAGSIHTLADRDYVLCEYKYQSSYGAVRSSINELLSSGYTPVIAHAERYALFEEKPEIMQEFRNMGALIQINAGSIVGAEGRSIKRLCKKALKLDLVDIVASDSHNIKDRRCYMKEACVYVAKKYGEERAVKLFEKNPAGILENE